MRVKLAAACVAVALIVSVGLWWSRSTPSPLQPGEKASTANPLPHPQGVESSPAVSQGDLQALIVRDGLTPDRAKQLFSVVVGPLPGVTITTTPSTDPADFDGTSAVLDILQVRSSLTPEQQQAALDLINPPGRALRHAGTAVPAIVPVTFRLIDDPPAAYDYEKLLVDANATLAKMLGVPQVALAWLIDFDPPKGAEYAHTDWWTIGPGNEVIQFPDHLCHVIVHDQKMRTLTPDDARAVLTHETFHCYQGRTVGSYESYANLRPWIREGEATWVMAEVVPTVRAAIDKHWNAYAAYPQTRFHQREYDGIGVFGHMGDRAGDAAVWNKLLLIANDGGLDKYGFAAFDDLIAGWEADYFQSWGSSYFLAKQKPAWNMNGPAHPPDSGIAPTKQSIPLEAPQSLGPIGPYESQLFELTSDADVLGISLLTGYGRLHDQGFAFDSVLDSSGPTALCLKMDGCACPDGTLGASTITERATAPISIGLNGGRTGAQVAVIGQSLNEYCKGPEQKPGPEPPGPPGGGGGGGGDPDPPQPEKPPPGSSHGDTHLLTFDGLKYDFQAVGEYTLARSMKDDFVVQTRQVPVLQSKTVSVNQAMATKIAGHRITIALENNAPVLRVDGAIVGDVMPKLSGGSLTRARTIYGTTYTLEWPDATTVRVEQLGPRALNVRVVPAKARMGSLAGLLGDGDGSTANDLIGANDAKLGTQPSPEAITHSLADRWRVTTATSLFDYLPGQSTATFVDPAFPNAYVDPTRVPNRETAEKNCREAGITDTRLLENCIVDFGVTSDFLFAATYSHEQQVVAARARIASKRAGLLRTLMFEGTIAKSGDAPSLQFDARAGDVLWIGQPDCTDNYTLRGGLIDPNGKSLGFDALCVMGRHVLPVSGTYTLRTSNGNPPGSFHVPIRFVRADQVRPVKNNDVLSGRIESRGIHDLYTFDGHNGDVVRVSGEGCDMGTLVLGFLLPGGRDILGPGCRAGSDTRLTEDGPYKLVVNAADLGPGEYHFVFQIVSTNAGK